MKKKVWKTTLVVGLVLLLVNSVSLAKKITENISVRFADIQLILNGKEIQTSAEPFIYKGNVYAPVATIANALGVRQTWYNDMPAVWFDNTNRLQDEVDYYYTSKAKYSEMGRVKGGRTIYMFENWMDSSLTLLENSRSGLTPISYEIPRLELDGYDPQLKIRGTQKPITRSFAGYNYFFMTEHLLNLETNEEDAFLHLLLFEDEKNEVVSLGSRKLGTNDRFTKYTGDVIDRKLYLNQFLYNEDMKEHELAHIEIYSWDQEGKITLDDTYVKHIETVN